MSAEITTCRLAAHVRACKLRFVSGRQIEKFSYQYTLLVDVDVFLPVNLVS